MKKPIIASLLLLCLIGCSKDKVDPDPANQFVGRWQSEIEKTELYNSQSEITIGKSRLKELRLSLETRRTWNTGSDHDIPFSEVYERVKVFDLQGGVMQYDTSTSGSLVHLSGYIEKEKLLLTIKNTDVKTGVFYESKQSFTKISP